MTKNLSPELPADPKPLDHLARCGAPDDPAIIDKQGIVDFAGFDAMVGAVASWLAGQGLDRGDRFASWLNKTRLACILPLAAARAGLIYVPINPLLKHGQAAHILADSGAKLLISGKARLARLEDGDVPEGCATIDEHDVPTEGDVMTPSAADPAEIVEILYTSGSTGRPKGVVLSHANLWLGAVSVSHYLGVTPQDRTLCVLPLSFDAGQSQLLSTWRAGAAAIPLDYLMARDVMRAVDRFDANVMCGVPPLWVQLAEIDWEPEIAAKLRVLSNTGGKMPVPLVRRLREIFPGAALHSMYGLTEAFRSTTLDPELIDTMPESIGKAVPFAEIMVVTAEGKRAEPGEPGELVHAGPLVSQGYWQDPERTAARFKPAPEFSEYGGTAVWSGDTVERDAEGYLRFVGRDDSMIKTAGNRISPSEIEDAAIASGVAPEACAFGVPDPRLGAAIMLVVRGSSENDEALKRFLKAELPNFMQPKAIVWQDDLPRNPNGKLDRTAIERQWGESA